MFFLWCFFQRSDPMSPLTSFFTIQNNFLPHLAVLKVYFWLQQQWPFLAALGEPSVVLGFQSVVAHLQDKCINLSTYSLIHLSVLFSSLFCQWWKGDNKQWQWYIGKGDGVDSLVSLKRVLLDPQKKVTNEWSHRVGRWFTLHFQKVS